MEGGRTNLGGALLTHLIQPRELFGPPARQEELRECWKRNEGLFDHYTTPSGRPTVTELLALFKPEAINVLGNSDIFYDVAFTDQVRAYYTGGQRKSNVMALSRYDVAVDGTVTFWDHADSADTWVVHGKPEGMTIPWPLGMPGIDNRMAYEFQKRGYDVINPARTIRTYHLHLSEFRSYLVGQSGTGRSANKIKRVPPPYKLVPPTELR